MGLKEDINLKGDEYQWLGSIFYIGFLVWEVGKSLKSSSTYYAY